MKNDKWFPVLITLLLVGMGVFVVINTVLGAKGKKDKNSDTNKNVSGISQISTKQAATDTAVSTTPQKGEIAVLRAIDKEDRMIGVYLLSELEETSYSYDSATSVKSINDKELVMEELPLGSIINIEKKSDGVLSKVAVNKASWDYKGVKNLQIDEVTSTMSIGERNFTYDAGITVISNEMLTEIGNLSTSKDILEVRGIGEKVLSIEVTKGHGILDFKNYKNFLGGSIEVGYDVFDEISDNMRYVLREGRYKVIMSNGGYYASKVVDIKRDKREVLDLSKYSNMTKSSEVSFKVSPKNATVYVDGKEIEKSFPIKLRYGEYIIKVTADSYESWEKIVKISEPKTLIKAKLKEAEDDIDDDDEDDDIYESERKKSNRGNSRDTGDDANSRNDNVSGHRDNSENDEISDEKRDKNKYEAADTDNERKKIKVRTDSTSVISFRKPVGATIRFDGKIIGDAPCEITKVTGEHEITISKDGYQTSTYTVRIADDGEDAIFSFPEMEKEKE